jgi:hypothetical protein
MRHFEMHTSGQKFSITIWDALSSLCKILSMQKLIVALAVVLVAFACAGPDQPSTSVLSRRLVRIEYPEDSTATMVIGYNAEGDVERIYNSTDTAIYHYAGDSIVLNWTDGYGKTVATQQFKTNGEGRVISNDVRDPEGQLFTRTTYTYNTEGRLTTLARQNMRTNDTFSLNYTYEGENLVDIYVVRNGLFTDRYHYEYDMARPNKFLVDVDNISNDIFARERMGKLNRHLMTRSYRMTSGGDTTVRTNYFYQFDKDGYVISRTDTDGQFGYSTERRYLYQSL